MKFFLDTANLDEIKTAADWGILDGVTTNPSLVAKEGVDFQTRVQEICEVVPGPVSAEVVATDTEGIIREARELSSWAPNVVVKVPLIPDGIKAVCKLSAEDIKVNVTLCFSPLQAVLAAKAGATYISPFVGRLDDIGHDGMELVEQIVQIYLNYGFETEVIVASIRHPGHIVRGALIGAHIATVPFAVAEKMFKHPLTDIGLKSFLADWAKVQKGQT